MNKKKYDNAFVEVFAITPDILDDNFSRETVDTWDSIHQLNIIALIEEEFDVMFEPEDIMGFTSYKAGKEILKNYDIEL